MRILFLFLVGFFWGNSDPKETVDLTIVVTNIKTITGRVEVGVFNQSKTFLQKGKAYKSYNVKVTDNVVTIILKDVPKDYYAVSVYHDKNADNECNLNFLGIPREPYGFSKNFKPKLSKPTFDDCKVNTQKNTSIVIKLIN